MPSLIDIRRRIRSVKNTRQITKAMKMVSAAKLRRAQERALQARPFAQMLTNVLQSVVTRAELVDPKTGVMKEFPLKSPNTGPHGLTEDKAGNIWFTGNSSGLVGKLDPKTGEVTEYRMPNPAARDPHQPPIRPHVLPVGERANQPAALRLRQTRIGRVPDQRVPEQSDLPTTLLTTTHQVPPDARVRERGTLSAQLAHE